MISYQNLICLHNFYNGPLLESERFRTLFDLDNQYECARALIMVQHFSEMSSALIRTIGSLGQDTFAKTQRIFFRQELTELLRQRRKWKVYQRSLGDCPHTHM